MHDFAVSSIIFLRVQFPEPSNAFKDTALPPPPFPFSAIQAQ